MSGYDNTSLLINDFSLVSVDWIGCEADDLKTSVREENRVFTTDIGSITIFNVVHPDAIFIVVDFPSNVVWHKHIHRFWWRGRRWRNKGRDRLVGLDNIIPWWQVG